MGQSLQSNGGLLWRYFLILTILVTAGFILSFVIAKMHPYRCVRPTTVPDFLKEEIENLEWLEEPRRLYVQVDTPLLPLAEKDVVVRSAFVNFFPRKEKFKNSTTILLEVKKSLLEENAIQSCGVEDFVTSQFEV